MRPQSEVFKAVFPSLPHDTLEVQLEAKSTSFRFKQVEDALIMFIRLADLVESIKKDGVETIRSPCDYPGKRARYLSKDVVLGLSQTWRAIHFDCGTSQDLKQGVSAYLEAWYSHQITQAESEPWKVYFYLKLCQITEQIVGQDECLKIRDYLNEQISHTSKDPDHFIWQQLKISEPKNGYTVESIESECQKLRPDVLLIKSNLLDLKGLKTYTFNEENIFFAYSTGRARIYDLLTLELLDDLQLELEGALSA